MSKRDSVNDVHSYGLDVNNREIYVHSYYDLFWTDEEPEIGVDFRMSTLLSKNINLLNNINKNPILIHSESIGGDWYSCLSMMDNLILSASPTTVLSRGTASSASSIFIQGADLRLSSPNTIFMIHYGSSVFSYENNIRSVEQSLSIEKCGIEFLLDLYSTRMMSGRFAEGKSIGDVRSWLENKLDVVGDWYLTATDAKYYGFIDDIITSSEIIRATEKYKWNLPTV